MAGQGTQFSVRWERAKKIGRGCLLGLTSLTLVASGIASPVPSFAHHSFSMFDMTKTEVMVGQVTRFRWQMPHVWLIMDISNPDGTTSRWQFEGHAPNILARKGWNRATLKAGDMITVRMHPMHDGSNMGSIINVEFSDGTVLWNAESEGRV